MKSHTSLNFLLAFILLGGICLSGWTSWLLYDAEEKVIVNEFQQSVNRLAIEIYHEALKNFEASQSLLTLYNNGEIVPSYDRFNNEARRLLVDYPGIHALGWIPRTARDRGGVSLFEVGAYFSDNEKSGTGEAIDTEGARGEALPVFYIEPVPGNSDRLGFDLAASPLMPALRRAMDEDLLQVTAPVDFVQEGNVQRGVVSLLPVYKGNPTTVVRRRQALFGFVVGVYQIDDILVSSHLTEDLAGIKLKLVDITSPVSTETLYSRDPRNVFVLQQSAFYQKKMPVILGRQWCLEAFPTVLYVERRRGFSSQLIFVFGIIFTSVVAFVLRAIVKKSVLTQEKLLEKKNELQEVNRKLKLVSSSDGLTGVFNRRTMDNFLSREWARAMREKSSISFIMADIDNFKLYNDNYGHLTGDECLKKVAEQLRKIPHRSTDLVARYGGEEFSLVLLNTTDAASVAEDCRRAIEDLQIAHAFSPTSNVVTISAGVSTCIPKSGMDSSLLVAAADKALYRAKRLGRNRIATNICEW
ncbi:diguanylate cyclase [Desulfotalea psychrophila]|uniref:diguanylate cyclase n=1 Tax=Desulfotalea psychrophila (strain LSv54 / DSM 12343) TaxID=177439 RepID=Q6AK77_DESPS|nr:diguanylate cyclase [Desulfotalea psychrophila]CAG37249.1 probable sensory transduction system, regulatory protein [Desulfotalea psychrophila LSv54]